MNIARMHAVALAVIVAISGASTGCASSGTAAGSPGSTSNVLTREQLASTNAITVYDGIATLRPNWLTSRGPSSINDPTPTTASVYMNGSEVGDIDSLKGIRIADVTAVRYWDAGQATSRFGVGHPRGVLEVMTQ